MNDNSEQRNLLVLCWPLISNKGFFVGRVRPNAHTSCPSVSDWFLHLIMR